jgi:hypothetical protein
MSSPNFGGAGTPSYKGTPYYNTAQAVPGRVLPVLYDVGGEGVAFHDTDTINPGSGRLNPGNHPNDKFRINEPVGTTYTKPNLDVWQNSGEPLVPGHLYLGWTQPGEWVNLTLNVAKKGKYKLRAQMSSNNKNAKIRLHVNGVDKSGLLTIASTTHWHTWNIFENLATLHLPAGNCVLTIEFVKEGNMNIAWMDFIAA